MVLANVLFRQPAPRVVPLPTSADDSQGMTAVAELRGGGHRELRLPPTALGVRASGKVGKRFLFKKFEDVQPGATLDIVLEPKR